MRTTTRTDAAPTRIAGGPPHPVLPAARAHSTGVPPLRGSAPGGAAPLPDSGRLDPVGRAWLPRRGTLLRLATVAVLLLTAAGVVYAGDGRPEQPDPRPGRPVTVGPTGSPVDGQPPGMWGAAPGGWGEPPGPTRLPIPAGLVGVPVRLADPTGLAVLRPGDRVDLLAVPAAGGEPVVVAARAPVLAVNRAATALLLALRPEQSEAVVGASDERAFAIIVR